MKQIMHLEVGMVLEAKNMHFVSKSRPNDNNLPPYEAFEFVLFKDIVVAQNK